MRIRLAVPEQLHPDDAEPALNAALEAVTRASEPFIESGKWPTFVQGLKRGVRWKPEPPGDEHFDLASTVLRRGWGDCDDLAPWHAASLRAEGRDPGARAVVYRSGPTRWHAVVQRSDGRIDDPSRAAGMGAVGGDDYAGPWWRTMAGERLALAAYPGYGGWHARADVPDAENTFSWSHLASGRTPARSVVGAIRGIVRLGRAAPHHALMCGALHDMLCGYSPNDVAAGLEQHDAVGFLPLLAPAAMSLAAPLVSKILPGGGGAKGGGAPASSAAPGGGGGAPGGGGGGAPGPGTVLHSPGGPIIVRF